MNFKDSVVKHIRSYRINSPNLMPNYSDEIKAYLETLEIQQGSTIGSTRTNNFSAVVRRIQDIDGQPHYEVVSNRNNLGIATANIDTAVEYVRKNADFFCDVVNGNHDSTDDYNLNFYLTDDGEPLVTQFK